jgi:hypothetical protein
VGTELLEELPSRVNIEVKECDGVLAEVNQADIPALLAMLEG